MDRFSKLLVCVLGAVTMALVAAAFLAAAGRPRGPLDENALGNPPGIEDRLDLIDSPAAFERGKREHIALRPGTPAALELDDNADAFPRAGTWTSAETATAFAFTELLPSWNVSAPPDTGLRMDVRVRGARSQRWSPWLYLGSWGRMSNGTERRVTCSQGVVNIDYLALDAPADAYQVRVRFESFSFDPQVVPTLRRLAVAYSGVTGATRNSQTIDGWVRDLAVPFRTQKDAPKPLAGEICSPTSVSMVLAYWGVDKPVVENALAVYDAENEIFGNWGRAVARAGELGMDGWLTRFRNWDRVKAEIAAGQPVIASIRFKAGTFPSAVLPSTGGHLIVIRGFNAAGDVIVNDPASKERGNGAVYRADELARAWFDHGGVGYVIRRPGGTPVALSTARRE
jgi:hypothetical protein